jgi:hypothetical protein
MSRMIFSFNVDGMNKTQWKVVSVVGICITLSSLDTQWYKSTQEMILLKENLFPKVL